MAVTLSWKCRRTPYVHWSSTGGTGTVTYDIRDRDAKYNDSTLSKWNVILKGGTSTKGTARSPDGVTVCYEVRVVRIDSLRRLQAGRVTERATDFAEQAAGA